MRLSQKADYGLAAILYLSQKNSNHRYSLAEICREMGIPEEFLRKIFQTLVKSGIVNSYKGKGGGVSLARSPKDISLFEVIEPLEENGFVRCLRGEYCPRANTCAASGFWEKMQKRFFEVLKKTSIKDLIDEGKVEGQKQT